MLSEIIVSFGISFLWSKGTCQRRQWVGTYDAATVAEIYLSYFKDETIVFLAGLLSYRAALASTQLTLRAVT